MIGELYDSLVAIFSPQRGLERAIARSSLNRLRTFNAGKINRTTKSWDARPQSGDTQDLGELRNMRARAWDLWRNNQHVRKAGRATVAQVIGCGMIPQSQAKKPSGDSYVEFRKQAKVLWSAFHDEASYLGRPGYGGLTLTGLACQSFLETMWAGEIFVRFRELTDQEWAQDKRTLPFAIELIESERVPDETAYLRPSIQTGNYIYRGIEYDANGKRVAYHVYSQHPQDPRGLAPKTERILADQILHIYTPDRPSSTRGYSWLSSAMLNIRDIGDYQFNEMTASLISSCVVLAITRNGSSSGGSLLNTPAGESSTDTDGNTLGRIQPGMIFDKLKPGEGIQGFSPNRPNSNAEAFIQYMLRATAGSLPGLKASTLTGDYRNSSFSSEKSADNDCWRETEQVQEWFAAAFYQPIWERVITSGVENGFFDALDLRVFRRDAFNLNRRLMLACLWQGPVAKSINPTDDETASELALTTGTSSLQRECQLRGENWEDILSEQAEEKVKREELGLPLREGQMDPVTLTQTSEQNAKRLDRLLGVRNGQNHDCN